ncbi:hypothetical protein KY084_03410 [Stakelama sp. CBK3Z-3]|uniref:Uncharacterized protein n=1 Tax=Stakelama flava TaxID=2860338 RepID=A0ABS6XIC0_9SPHN|nr:hypothetical protein [Stakelama flava]MBW4329922.1 hypothetical protein [Stakelama flava]
MVIMRQALESNPAGNGISKRQAPIVAALRGGTPKMSTLPNMHRRMTADFDWSAHPRDRWSGAARLGVVFVGAAACWSALIGTMLALS